MCKGTTLLCYLSYLDHEIYIDISKWKKEKKIELQRCTRSRNFT